jgi:hypothetical protein
MLHDGTGGGDNGCWSSNAGTGKVWGMEVVEPSGHFVRRGVCEKEANLTFDMLSITIDIRLS